MRWWRFTKYPERVAQAGKGRRENARAARGDDARSARRDDARPARRDDARAPRRDDARAPRGDDARAARRDMTCAQLGAMTRVRRGAMTCAQRSCARALSAMLGEPALGLDRGGATHARGGDGLAINVIGAVAGDINTGHVGLHL